MSEEEAKQKWLAKLDAPTWGKAASAVIEVVAEASKIADLTEECEAGDSAACETLSKEDEAKKAWLAKLDVPAVAWGKGKVTEIASRQEVRTFEDPIR